MAIDPFGHAETRYRDLLARRDAGDLDGPAFRAAVRDLRVRDLDGREWVMGPANGRWYRRERGRGAEAGPPRRPVCPPRGHPHPPRPHLFPPCGGGAPPRDRG